MGLINRKDIPAPDVPSEEVEVPEWGGSVQVRAIMLEEYLAIGEAEALGDYGHIARYLAATVMDAEGQPVLDVEGWRRFAAGARTSALRLYEVAYRLSGGDRATVEKN